MSSPRRRAELRREREEQAAQEERERSVRWHNNAHIPEAFRGAYLEMEDQLGGDAAETVLRFVEAYFDEERRA